MGAGTNTTPRAKSTVLTAREQQIIDLGRRVVSLLASIAPLPDADPAWKRAQELAQPLPELTEHALLQAVDAVLAAVDDIHKGAAYSRWGQRSLLSSRSTRVRQTLALLRLRVREELGDE